MNCIQTRVLFSRVLKGLQVPVRFYHPFHL